MAWMYAWTASRTSAERFPCDVFSFKNASISSRFSFSSRSVIRSFSSIQVPRPDRGNPYDEVIQHSARFLACCRRIQHHDTYTLCQLSYDVGQRAFIGWRNRPPTATLIFISYARQKTPKSLTSDAQIRGVPHREKLYEKRSYLRAWRRDPARSVAGNRWHGPVV